MAISFSWRRYAAPCVLSSVAVVGPAHALDGDRIRPNVGATYTYVSNLFYLDDSIPTQNLPFLKDGQKNDQILGLRAGLDADIQVSRQVFRLRSSATDNRYATYDNLDYVSYNVRGAWDWMVGPDWDGDVGISQAQVLGSFADINFNVRNVRKTQELFASGMYRLTPDWKLRAAMRRLTLDNSAAAFTSTDREDMFYELGSRYYSKGRDNYLGLNLRVIDGTFPNREVVPGVSTIDNSYRQYTLEGVMDWRYSGLSQISGSLGWTNRLHDQLPERDFSGVTGRLSGLYSPSGTLGFNAAVFREIGGFDDVTSSYILTQGVQFGPNYIYSDKLTFQASYSYRNRKFLGDPGFVLTSLPVRVDDVQSLSASAIWSPRRNVQVNATLSYDTRTSNRQFREYHVTTFFTAVQLTF
ncbi:MAG: XrtB/PEP-CTERM-associated polysaccharide biosynthesis outer membrane protein EpsL [Betaproteobacteria bacterium]